MSVDLGMACRFMVYVGHLICIRPKPYAAPSGNCLLNQLPANVQYNTCGAAIGTGQSCTLSCRPGFLPTGSMSLRCESMQHAPCQALHARTIARSGVTVTQLLCFRCIQKCTEVPHSVKCGRHFHLSFQYKMCQRVPPTFCRVRYSRSGHVSRIVRQAIVTWPLEWDR
jgi:hypothetical protein